MNRLTVKVFIVIDNGVCKSFREISLKIHKLSLLLIILQKNT